MKTRPPSLFDRALARILSLIPTVEIAHVVETVERADAVLRVLLALERGELADACRAAVAAEEAASVREGRATDHGAALAAAERRMAAEWRLVWGDPVGAHEPRKLGAWPELRAAQVAHDLEVRAGGDGAEAAARLKAAKDALVRVLPAAARKLAGELLAYPVEHARQ